MKCRMCNTEYEPRTDCDFHCSAICCERSAFECTNISTGTRFSMNDEDSLGSKTEGHDYGWHVVPPTDLGPRDFPSDDPRCFHWSVEDWEGATVAIELNKDLAKRIANLPALESRLQALEQEKAAALAEVKVWKGHHDYQVTAKAARS